MQSVEEIVAKILNIKRGEINDATGPANSSGWDSFNALMIAAEIEKVFQTDFSIDEIASIKSVGDIKRILKAYGKVGTTL